jgi:hypothetical protein
MKKKTLRFCIKQLASFQTITAKTKRNSATTTDTPNQLAKQQCIPLKYYLHLQNNAAD